MEFLGSSPLFIDFFLQSGFFHFFSLSRKNPGKTVGETSRPIETCQVSMYSLWVEDLIPSPYVTITRERDTTLSFSVIHLFVYKEVPDPIGCDRQLN